MATLSRRENSTLKEKIFQQYGNFNVDQLIRLLLAGNASTLPIEQRLRFRANLSAAFPAHEFSHLAARQVPPKTRPGQTPKEGAANDEVIDISTANYCVASVMGPLPEPFTEWVRDLAKRREPAMADFLDIFNQRLNILRYQFREALNISLNSQAPAETPLAKAMASLIGLSTPGLASQLPLHPRVWLGLAGLLANERKSASTVVHVLSLLLHTQVRLIPLIGAWRAIESGDRTVLGKSNLQLGRQTVLGKRIWDQQARIRIAIGPIDYRSLCRLLPPSLGDTRGRDSTELTLENSSYFERFESMLALLLDRQVDAEIELHVSNATLPLPRLTAGRGHRWRLGQTAWLNSAPEQGQQLRTRRVRYLIRAQDIQRPL